MKRAYLVNGTLSLQAAPKDNTLALDSVTWTYLQGLLGTDYCYLVVNKREVVKVQSVEAPNLALVVRGLEDTRRESWPINTPIRYGLTQSEIDDAVTFSGLQLTVEAPLQNNNGVLSYTELQLAGIGGCTVDGTDEGIWMIQDIPANAGCCSIAGQTPPPIPLSYFNLRIVTEGYYRVTEDGSYRAYI